MRRSLVVWFAMLVTASINGAVREAWLIPRLGDTLGRAISTLMLSSLVLLLCAERRPSPAAAGWRRRSCR